MELLIIIIIIAFTIFIWKSLERLRCDYCQFQALKKVILSLVILCHRFSALIDNSAYCNTKKITLFK